MKITVLLSTVLLVAVIARADVNYNMAIGQAKRAANSSEPSHTPPSQPPPSYPHNPPANPELQAAMRNIADLQADIAALTKATDASAAGAERIPLLNHLSAAAQGTKASSKSVKDLAANLISAIGQKTMSESQQSVLARYLHAFFNGGQLTATQQKAFLDGVKKIFTAAGVSDDQADKVLLDLKNITAETK